MPLLSVLRFFRSRPRRSRELDVLPSLLGTAVAASTSERAPERACLLASCSVGARATVLEMSCGDAEACRLRALGVCEGASVSVLDARHAMVLDVRGTRIALGKALTSGITVRPLPA